MALAVPFRGIDRRTVWLRATLLSACFFGLLASAPLWLNSRTFPLLPITQWFPILPSPWDKWFLGTVLLALLVAGWFYRQAVTFFLVASLFAFCEDQNRGQPWLYMYWVMLWFTLLRAPISIAACRVALSVAYIWSGIQKCNPVFFELQPSWFVAPAAHWHLPSGAINLLRWSVASAPFTELAIGLGLWAPRLRRPAVAAALTVHLAALLFLGPLGHNSNWVVWPWNIAMIALTCTLFTTGAFWQKSLSESTPLGPSVRKASPKVVSLSHPSERGRVTKRRPLAVWPGPRIAQTFADLRRSKPALGLAALYSLLPILSFTGFWDSYFSFSLYAANEARANIFATRSFCDRLPPEMRMYFQQLQLAYDTQYQAPYYFALVDWCYEELHVPPIPEPRNYRSIFSFLRAYSREPSDLRMIIGPRAGPMVFYQGDSYEVLPSKR